MHPATTYQRHAIETASPVGLVVLLYQAAVADLRRALAATEAVPNTVREIEARTKALNHLFAIVGELKREVDLKRGGEVARNLQHFYVLSERLILQAGAQRDPQILRELIEHFSRILAAWRQVEARPPAAPAAQTAWSA
ncbi:MAG: flagellar export chaperone FliS [Terriglobales bacterium]